MLDNYGNQTWYMNQMADRLDLDDIDSESTFLIIHLDDFGAYPEANIASIECMENGSATSASIMPVGLAYDSAVSWSVANPDFDMGVHFTFTSEWRTEFQWGPLTDGISLADSNGFFRKTMAKQNLSMTTEDCADEMKAQIDRLLNDNVVITHADHHMGVTGQNKFLPDFMLLCDSYNVCGFVPPNISKHHQDNASEYSSVDHPWSQMIHSMFEYPMIQGPTWGRYTFPETFTYDSDNNPEIVRFKQFIKTTIDNLGAGIYKMIAHPAIDTPRLTTMMSDHHANPIERVLSYHTFRDSEIKNYCASKNIHLISYSDLGIKS